MAITALKLPQQIQPSTIAKPPTAPKNLTPPAARSTAGPGKQVNQGKINYGLPTTSKAAFNPSAVPTTVGAFNKEVNQSAEPSYLPQLQQTQADQQQENQLNKIRQTDIGSIYSQETNNTQQAFNEAQQALNAIIAGENSNNTNAQGVLGAALTSAQQPGNASAAMMGMTPAAASETLPYQAAATGATENVANTLGTSAGGELSNLAQGVAGTAEDRASALNQESARHQAEVQTLQSDRDAIVQGIPAAINTAREALIKDMQSAQNSTVQQQLAEKQYGLTAATTKANIQNQTATQKLNATNAATNRETANEQVKMDEQQIQVQSENATTAAQKAKADEATAIAKATSQQQVNAIKFLTSWSQPTKEEIVPAHKVTNPATGASTEVPQQVVKTWARNPQNALNTVMVNYGVGLQEALTLMTTVNTPIGGNKGTVGQWAQNYLNRISGKPEGVTGSVSAQGAKISSLVPKFP